MRVARSWEPNLGHLGNQIIVGNCELIKLNHGVKVIKIIQKKKEEKTKRE
jgi:hypothetical protein